MIHFMKKLKSNTFRSYITIVLTLTVMFIVIICGIFFYHQTFNILYKGQHQQLSWQLHQVNSTAEEQIGYIDSIYPMFLSNTLIRDSLEPMVLSQSSKLSIERQMNFLLTSSYLWQENYISGVYIFTPDMVYSTFSSAYHPYSLENNQKILNTISKTSTSLMINTLKDDTGYIYFSRNIFSSDTGQYIATIIININKDTWIEDLKKAADENWLVYLYSDEIELATKEDSKDLLDRIKRELTPAKIKELYGKEFHIDQELRSGREMYLLAANNISRFNITTCVAAPKSQLSEALQPTLQYYILVLIGILLAGTLLSTILSQLIIRPVQQMIYHINRISKRETNHVPAPEMFSELNDIVFALNNMIQQLNTYYEDNLEKHMLLKNAEIHALQTQLNPHFLFNTLNTIAWKAQIANDEEVYQMVISLGEMLKTNICSRDTTFITLEEELNYIKFYTYLLKMRFEDKITVTLQVDESLFHYLVPRFCIQALVENSFSHGLEPKKGNGRLIINIIAHEHTMEISVIDDGVGFKAIPDIKSIQSTTKETHTHIGLKNLNRRLSLLYDESVFITIKSTPNICTIVSFIIPLKTEV